MNSFDPVSHTYVVDDRPAPGVTGILGDLIPGWKADPWYLDRGTQVHAAAAYIAMGRDFDYAPEIEGQVQAGRRFFTEVKPPVLAVELQVYSSAYCYGGTLDLFSFIKGEQCVVDYKSALTPAVPYQVAAYAIAYAETMRCAQPKYGLGVALRDDGTYRMSEVYDLKRYKQGWLALLTTYGIRRRCNIKTEEGDQ